MKDENKNLGKLPCDVDRACNLFDRIDNGINQVMKMFIKNSDKFDRTFDSKEAEDFLKKFK